MTCPVCHGRETIDTGDRERGTGAAVEIECPLCEGGVVEDLDPDEDSYDDDYDDRDDDDFWDHGEESEAADAEYEYSVVDA